MFYAQEGFAFAMNRIIALKRSFDYVIPGISSRKMNYPVNNGCQEDRGFARRDRGSVRLAHLICFQGLWSWSLREVTMRLPEQ